MEFLIEVLLDLLIDGSIEISSNKRFPKWIRYPLIIFLIIFFLGFYILIFGVGILILKDNIYASIFILLIGLILLISGIIKFKKLYLERK